MYFQAGILYLFLKWPDTMVLLAINPVTLSLHFFYPYFTESGLPPEKIKEMVDWMKVHKYPVSDVEGYMKETAIYRGEWIRSNLEGIPQASRQSWHGTK